MVEKGTRTLNVSIATEKDTGFTNAHERHPDSHQQPNTSKKTVKYNFLILHDREHEFENIISNNTNNSFSTGSLKKTIFLLEKLHQFVLNIIGNGYLIPFFSTSAYLSF